MVLRRPLVRLLAALALGGALAATALASPTTTAAASSCPLLTGESICETLGSGNLAPGAINQPYSSPAVGDLLNNGTVDIVTGSLDGWVRVFNSGGGLVWQRNTGGAIQSSPTLADLGNNGQLEVVVTSRNGYINVFDPNGNNYPGWPQFPSNIGNWNSKNFGTGFFSSAAVGSLFGDGAQDIVATSLDHRLYAWNATGGLLPGFPINLWDTSLDTPTLVDLLGNGQRDIVVGSDSSGQSSEPYPIGGVYWAFQPNGHLLWVRTQNEVPWGSSAAGVLNPGDTSPAIVGATGNWVHQSHPSLASAGQYLNVFTTSGGNRFSFGALATPGTANFASPAIGDLFHHNDGSQEIVDVGENGHIYAWDGNGTLLWQSGAVDGDQLGSPIIAPLGGGACGGGNGVWVPGTWFQGFCAGNSGPGADAYFRTPGPSYGAPTVADLGNGRLSLVGIYETDANNNAWQLGVFPLVSTSTLSQYSWPTFHGSAQRAGTQAAVPNPQDPGWVGNLYHDVLGRTNSDAPSASEIGYWVNRLDNGASPAWVASQFIDSTEAHGFVVDADYQLILNRAPDPNGRAFWVGQLNAGVHNEVLLGLLGGSNEFWTDHGNDPTQVVDTLYQLILKRPPTGDPGVAYWINQLQTGAVQRAAIGDAFANSHEYHMDVVSGWYSHYLGRTPDVPGQTYWADYLDAGNSDDAGIIQIVCSNEYFGHTPFFP